MVAEVRHQCLCPHRWGGKLHCSDPSFTAKTESFGEKQGRGIVPIARAHHPTWWLCRITRADSILSRSAREERSRSFDSTEWGGTDQAQTAEPWKNTVGVTHYPSPSLQLPDWQARQPVLLRWRRQRSCNRRIRLGELERPRRKRIVVFKCYASVTENSTPSRQ